MRARNSALQAAGLFHARFRNIAFEPFDRASALSVSLPSSDVLGDAIVPAGSARGNFVDVEAEVAIRFDQPAPELCAGFWLRATADEDALTVMLWRDGVVSACVRERGAFAYELCGVYQPELDPRAERDCKPGTIQLRAQVGDAPTRVTFRNPAAWLP